MLKKRWVRRFSPAGRFPAALAAAARFSSSAASFLAVRDSLLPLQVPPMPEEFKEWAQDTLLATFAGMLFGGGKRWAEERSAGGGTSSRIAAAARRSNMSP